MANYILHSVAGRIFLILFWLLSTLSLPSFAAETSVSWLPNSEQNLAGYKIRYGQLPGNYTSVIDMGKPATLDGRVHGTINNLSDGTTYYAVITAYDTADLESVYSSQISWTTPGGAGGNNPPVATGSSFTTPANTPINDQLAATDPDGDTLTFSIATTPLLGSATTNNSGAFTYTPNAGVSGSDSFTFLANDGQINSQPATISITINRANQAPTADNAAIPTDQGTPVSGQLQASDPDGDTLFFSIVTPPGKGSVEMTASGYGTYTPHPTASGTDSFTFKVNDGTVDSNTATVTITINGTNSQPTANNAALATDKNTPLSGQLTATDPDGDSLTFSAVAQPSKGTVTVNTTGSFTYTPNTDVTGTDSFTFKVNDGTVDSNTATVSITINSTNAQPVANNASVATDKNTPLSGQLTATDPDGDALTFSAVAQPSKGSVTVNTAGSFTYTPNTDVTGTDSFTFKVNDGTVDSNTATVSITINSTNAQPTAQNAALATDKNTPLSGQLTATDPDGDSLAFSAVAQPTKGSVTVNTAGSFTYTPNTDVTGTDSFTFKVNDGTVDSNTATVSITINSTNSQPTANNAALATDKNTPLNGQLTATDPDGDALTFSAVAQPSKGTVTVNTAGSFTYTPNTDVTGADSFTFKVNDGTVDSNTATVSITINSTNAQPTTQNAALATDKNTPLNGQLTATDPDGDSLTFSAVAQPTKGSVTVNTSGSFTYTPNTDVTGADSFTFKVNDGTVDSNTATVSITINSTNAQPVANNAALATDKNTPLSGQLTATDPDGDSLAFSAVAQPTKGSVTVNTSGSFTYTPNTDVRGEDSFTFKVNDGTVDSNTASVSIRIDMPTVTRIFGQRADADYPGTIADTFTNVNETIYADSDSLASYSWSTPAPHTVANTIIVKINLESIPANAIIHDAQLSLFQTTSVGEDEYRNSIHQIISKDPAISETSGYRALNNIPWSSVPAGTTYSDVPLGLADIGPEEDARLLGTEEGYKSWNVTHMVQEWVNDSANNHGLLLKGETTEIETGRTFASSENQNEAIRPMLTVVYSIPAPPTPRILSIRGID